MLLKKESKKKNETMEMQIGLFECKEKLGEGTYGIVYHAVHKQTGEIVAIKSIKFDKDDDGFPSTTLREISLLKTCSHLNIVSLKDIIYTSTEKKMVPDI